MYLFPNYHKLIDGVYQLKKDYGSSDRYWKSASFLDTSYLRYPTHQTVQVLEDGWEKAVYQQARQIDFLGVPMFDHAYVGYSDIEIQKVKRTYDWMVADVDENQIKRQRRNFGYYFRAHDERRGTDFCKTFPEWDITIITGGDPIGVGESTTPHMNQYLHYMGIPDAVFMPAARATYKSSSRFEGFVAEGEVFHYPNGQSVN